MTAQLCMGYVRVGKYWGGGAVNNASCTSIIVYALTTSYTIILLVWFGKPSLFALGNLDLIRICQSFSLELE